MPIQAKDLVTKKRVRQATKDLFDKFTDDLRTIFSAGATQWPTDEVPDAMGLDHSLSDSIHASVKDMAVREYGKVLKQLEQ